MKNNNNKSRILWLKNSKPKNKTSWEFKSNVNKKWKKNTTKISSKEPIRNKMSKELWKSRNMKRKNYSKKSIKKCSRLILSRENANNSSSKDNSWKRKSKNKNDKCSKKSKNSNKAKSIPMNSSKASQWKTIPESKWLQWKKLKKSKFNRVLSANLWKSQPKK